MLHVQQKPKSVLVKTWSTFFLIWKGFRNTVLAVIPIFSCVSVLRRSKKLIKCKQQFEFFNIFFWIFAVDIAWYIPNMCRLKRCQKSPQKSNQHHFPLIKFERAYLLIALLKRQRFLFSSDFNLANLAILVFRYFSCVHDL